MDKQHHWEQVYGTKSPDRVSWFRPHLELSLQLIERAVTDRGATILDVGGGASTLVDDLLLRGYDRVTVLDISQAALDAAQGRLGEHARRVTWLRADVTQDSLPKHSVDVWHDRAVFHFLTDPGERTRYVQQVVRSVKPGGHVIVSTFGLDGPEKCSGLEVMRYDASTLHDQFGARFRLVDSAAEQHLTPFGTTQQFLYCYCILQP